MKNLILLCLFAIGLTACSREEFFQTSTTNNAQLSEELIQIIQNCPDCVCKNAQGIVMRCKTLLAEISLLESRTDGEEVGPRYKYITESCTLENGQAGLKCKKKKNGDCQEEIATCTVCANCF